MTVVERDLYHLGNRIDEHLQASKEGHEAIAKILDRLDARDDTLDRRVDKVDLRLAAVAGVIAFAVFAAQLLAPLLQGILGLPSS
jgi:hypothetical protein